MVARDVPPDFSLHRRELAPDLPPDRCWWRPVLLPDFSADRLIGPDLDDERVHAAGGLHLTKDEILSMVNYATQWPQRHCMCCFKDFKNFERFNNIVQVILTVAIRFIQTLPEDIGKERNKAPQPKPEEDEKSSADKTAQEQPKEEAGGEKEKETPKPEKGDESKMEVEGEEESEHWEVEEKERLLQFVTKIFLMNFPSYTAHKHIVHNSLEDPESPLYLLRNVCFLCDSNGIQALRQCFEKATPETLSFNFAHILITLIANDTLSYRRYMCKLSDADLRLAGNRSMTDLMWAAVKEPLDTHFTFDREGLALAFKYFTCSTLTIRLTGIAQINNQINMYNETCNNESTVDPERFGDELAQWLLDNKIVEHIFGPNLHVEIIKQSQIILAFLAMEGRITNEHIDCIWAASQLKHCSKQVYDILIPLIKSLELQPNRHLLELVSSLDPSAHTESQQLQPHVGSYTALKHDASEAAAGLGKADKHEISTSDSEQEEDGVGRKRPVRGKGLKKDDHLAEMAKLPPKRKLHKHLPAHRGCAPNTQATESEECTESSDDEEDEDEETDEEARMEMKRERWIKMQEAPVGAEKKGERPLKPDLAEGGKKLNESSELEVCGHCQDHSEVDLDTDDEELMKEAKLVHLKHSYPNDSDDTSDFEEMEEEEAVMLTDMKRQYRVQHLQKQQQGASPNLLQQAANIVMRHKMQAGEHHPGVKAGPMGVGVGTEAHGDSQDESEFNVSSDRLGTSGSDGSPSKLPLVQMANTMQDGSGTCLGCAGSPSHHGDAGPGCSKPGVETEEIYDCSSIIQHMQASRRGRMQMQRRSCSSDYAEDILSPDDGSCHSSRMSTKSEKNMADFEGEEALSEEELAQINAHTHFGAVSQHIGSMASLYHSHLPRSVIHHRPPQRELREKLSSVACADFTFDDVCKKGNTLLWDLVQDDTAHLLPEGLALEAEKALYSLVCFTDRCIKTKFIEACVNNLAKHKSVVMSLRLLPKLFNSFQNYRWAEAELKMMSHFFNDLVHFTENKKAGSMPPNSLYSYREGVQVRLTFLTCVFSSMGSPDTFRLNQEQVDCLWNCLATDPVSTDDCLSWFLNQAKSKDHHALGVETFRHIFLEKIPQLSPERMTMIGLNLFQHLSHLTRMSNASHHTQLTEDQMCGMDQLWRIALQADNKDVSMTATQFLNNYYINHGGGTLDREDMFVSRCMASLTSTLNKVKEQDPACYLLRMQRGLVLLKNHLEMFRRRYAFHMRTWHLDGKGVVSHQAHMADKASTPLRILLQTTGMTEKTQLDMLSSDLVSELRAEVTRWWEVLQKQQQQQRQQLDAAHGHHGHGLLSPILGAMLGDGPIRMITLGQELTVDMDEKTLGELQFKDMQPKKLDGSLPSSCLPVPARERLPMILLLLEPHFDNLFTLLEKLSDMSAELQHLESQEQARLQAEARRLSRSVWELLMMLPTSRSHLQGFHRIVSDQEGESSGGDASSKIDWEKLLPPHSPHRLYYSLQIVESLAYGMQPRKKSLFVSRGGLSHLLSIFMNGTLQPQEGDCWSQWNQECLAYLLRLITQFSVDRQDMESSQEETLEPQDSPHKKLRRPRSKQEKVLIPRLTQSTLNVLNVEAVLKILMQILYDAALPLEVQGLLAAAPNLTAWLKRLTLEAPEPYVRKEACMGLYRLCLGRTADNKHGHGFLLPIVSRLLSFISDALLFKPQKHSEVDGKEKEPFGPGCRDYFWLVCHLVEALGREEFSSQMDNSLDLDGLVRQLANQLATRPYHETRLGYEEDDGLCGLLNLCTAILKHNPPFKNSADGRRFLDEIFQCLFALPSPSKRYFPRCKSHASRTAGYDLLVELAKGSTENYYLLHSNMMRQHSKESHTPYPWDYWPHEDGRSKCGYVGLTNLGATCYMATCMQHLYMIPQARESVLQAKCSEHTKHEGTLVELQKMFAYLQESERKAYNPKSFCKTYMMDKQPLNTGEQKDMTEFFTDLITKMEEMSPEMDCPHVSRTFEEFYTVRCQVADMKDLFESLDEVTVKDMLEGDNMYTCSRCQKKVRAEKRACFRRLPRILCFNTMRYTFNMVTMMKEKVNTHFSFPLRLDMSPYMEQTLLGPDKLKDCETDDFGLESELLEEEDACYEYELTGVTVHTGTADGGHYYSFIRDRLHPTDSGQDKWFLFNDAEVKPFDQGQIAGECFGGEMTSKTYDSVTDKFMDFSFEKTNSAYMLFYERCSPSTKKGEESKLEEKRKFNFEMSKELAEWIWQDNMQFLQDKNLFEHSYFAYVHLPCFRFMWQVCGYIPTQLPKDDPSTVALKAAQLSTSFVLETLIHSKEKPTMLQWIELLTKQFNSCHAACEWFLDHMADDDWWPQQILIKCPNQMVRQMFQRLVIHVIGQLRNEHVDIYLQPIVAGEDGEIDISELGNRSCITRFVKKMITIIEHGVRPHSKYLTEYFAFLLEFAKIGEEECMFLININAIATMVSFYMGQKAQENYVEILSDEEEEEEVLSLAEEAYRPTSLEKMIALTALLVEKSRASEKQLHLSQRDYNAIIGGKGFPFLVNQIRDNINIRQTCNLIFSLTRWNDDLAMAIVNMVFAAIRKLSPEALLQHSQPFFKLLSMLVEFVGGPPGMPPYTHFVLQRLWELTKIAPHPCLEWLTTQVTRNKLAAAWTLEQMGGWVEHYLIAHNNVRVRNAAAYLLIALVPSNQFRQTFRSGRTHKDLQMSPEAMVILHQIYEHLLSLLTRARMYVDPQVNGTTKLVLYFTVMNFCVLSKAEKLMFSEYFPDLWQLFQPKLLEPQIAMHHNKQALLMFWYTVCMDCPENIQLIVTNPHVCKNIAFNYILADHEDQDIMMFNRCMLPSYYGLLRLCCQQSRPFTRQLAQHQNIQWAFKNITPYPSQYTTAVEELYKMMRLMAARYPDSTEEELRAVNSFRRATICMYLHDLEARTHWQTLIAAFKILVEGMDERLLLICQNGLQTLSESFFTLHVMYHEATACHVTGEIIDLLTLLLQVLKTARECMDKKAQGCAELKTFILNWKERGEVVKKLLTLLNSYTPPEVRQICFDVLKQMVLTLQPEMIALLVPFLSQAHAAFQDNNVHSGPYFPRRGQKPMMSKSSIRPSRPQFQMFLHPGLLEAAKGVDDVYDTQVYNFFVSYHQLIDTVSRLAININSFSQPLINLGAMVAYEGVPIHSPYFAKLWNEVYHSDSADPDHSRVQMLCKSRPFINYCEAVLMDERMSLNNPHIYTFFTNFFPKVHEAVLQDQGRSFVDNLIASTAAEKAALENVRSEKELYSVLNRISGDVRAMLLLFSVQRSHIVSPVLQQSLRYILHICREHQHRRTATSPKADAGDDECARTDKAASSENTRADSVDSAMSEATGSKTGSGDGGSAQTVSDSESKVSQSCSTQPGDSRQESDHQSSQVDSTSKDAGASDTKLPASRGTSESVAASIDSTTEGRDKQDQSESKAEEDADIEVADVEPTKPDMGMQSSAEKSDVAVVDSSICPSVDVTEAEVMCVDVTEASESVEVCTTPSVAEAQAVEVEDLKGSGREEDHAGSKRQIGSVDGSAEAATEEPVKKRRRDTDEETADTAVSGSASPKQKAQPGKTEPGTGRGKDEEKPFTLQSDSSQKSGQLPEAVPGGLQDQGSVSDQPQTSGASPSQGSECSSSSSGAGSSGQSGSRASLSHSGNSNPDFGADEGGSSTLGPSTSAGRTERGASGDSEEGGGGPSGPGAGLGGRSNHGDIVDKVAKNIESLIALLEKSS
nr:hypothetical protein BaRGS_008439 [Batillaria attramentaria]